MKRFVLVGFVCALTSCAHVPKRTAPAPTTAPIRESAGAADVAIKAAKGSVASLMRVTAPDLRPMVAKLQLQLDTAEARVAEVQFRASELQLRIDEQTKTIDDQVQTIERQRADLTAAKEQHDKDVRIIWSYRWDRMKFWGGIGGILTLLVAAWCFKLIGFGARLV